MARPSFAKLLSAKKPGNVSHETLILADGSAKAREQVTTSVVGVLLTHRPREKAVALATVMTDGRWTHDFLITVEMTRQLDLPVSAEMPRIVYPQGGQGRPAVLAGGALCPGPADRA